MCAALPGPLRDHSHRLHGHRTARNTAQAQGPQRLHSVGIHFSPFCARYAFILLANEQGPMLGSSTDPPSWWCAFGHLGGPWHLADGSGILGFCGRASGKLSGLPFAFFFFFFLNKALISLDRQYNMVDMLTVCYLLGDLSKFLSLSPSFLSWKITSHGSYPLWGHYREEKRKAIYNTEHSGWHRVNTKVATISLFQVVRSKRLSVYTAGLHLWSTVLK